MNTECIPIHQNVQIIVRESIFNDSLLGSMSHLSIDCLIGEIYYENFLDYIYKKNILELRTLNNTFIQYDTKTDIWKTVSLSQSIIEEGYRKNEKECMQNNQLLMHYYLQGPPKIT